MRKYGICTAKKGRFAYLSWRDGLASRFVQFLYNLYSLYSFDCFHSFWHRNPSLNPVFGTIPSLFTNLTNLHNDTNNDVDDRHVYAIYVEIKFYTIWRHLQRHRYDVTFRTTWSLTRSPKWLPVIWNVSFTIRKCRI